jgi:hypothetical protein
MSKSVHSRRVMLQVLGAAGGALFVLPAVGCSGGGDSGGSQCNDTAGVDTAMRTTLHYTPSGPDAARRCSGCQLYTAGQNSCGSCQLFPGPVDPNGSCDSFVARA